MNRYSLKDKEVLDLIDEYDIEEDDYEELIDELNASDGIEVIDTGLQLGISLDNINAQYVGQFSSNREFVTEQLKEELSNLAPVVLDNLKWENIIYEYMQDYEERDGYYFVV